MVIPTANFWSYNSTGLNSIKADWNRNLYKLTNSDFISLQDNFKKTDSSDKFVKGGIAQMCDKNIDLKWKEFQQRVLE